MNSLDISPEQRQAGNQLGEARQIQDKYKTELKRDKAFVDSMKSKKAVLAGELDLLSINEDSSYQLQQRALDVKRDMASLEESIARSEKDFGIIEHRIKVSQIGVDKAQSHYHDVAQPSRTGSLTHSDINYLQALPPRTKMDMQDKIDAVNRYGRKAFEQYTKLI